MLLRASCFSYESLRGVICYGRLLCCACPDEGEERVLLQSLRGHLLVVSAQLLQVPGDGLSFSLCQFLVAEHDGLKFHLVPTPNAFVLGHEGSACLNAAVELCCGLGGISTGAQMTGVSVLGGLDISPWAVEVYNMNHHHDALLGDLADLRCASMLSHMTRRRSVGFLLGFPCPPFSDRGDRKGIADERALTFLQGLDLAYLLNASVLLLECTPKVETFAGVVGTLERFSKILGME